MGSKARTLFAVLYGSSPTSVLFLKVKTFHVLQKKADESDEFPYTYRNQNAFHFEIITPSNTFRSKVLNLV